MTDDRGRDRREQSQSADNGDEVPVETTETPWDREEIAVVITGPRMEVHQLKAALELALPALLQPAGKGSKGAHALMHLVRATLESWEESIDHERLNDAMREPPTDCEWLEDAIEVGVIEFEDGGDDA